MNEPSYSTKTQTFDAHEELVAANANATATATATGSDFYSYQFIADGCDTGRHEFNDHEELCRALVDDAFNHWCAWQERHDKFEQDCR